MFLIFQLFNFVLGSFNFSNLDQIDLDQLDLDQLDLDQLESGSSLAILCTRYQLSFIHYVKDATRMAAGPLPLLWPGVPLA